MSPFCDMQIYDLIQQNYFLFGTLMPYSLLVDVGLGVLHSGVVVDGLCFLLSSL